jgi:hypothetical protein
VKDVPRTLLEKTQSMRLQKTMVRLREWPDEIRAGAKRPQAKKFYEFFAKWLEGKTCELEKELDSVRYEEVR